MSERLAVAILGAGGFTGRELMLILSDHPHFSVGHITSNQHAGKAVGSVLPDLEGRVEGVFARHEDPIPAGVPVLLAVPNETSLERVPALLKAGHRVVDLSGVFRLHDRAAFEKSYNLKHTAFDLMSEAVYGMPELFRAGLRAARLVGNPGCFATGAILPLYLLAELRDQIADVVIDAKSGVSGAGGRSEDAGFAYNAIRENFRAYKILRHQHAPEIQEYAAFPGKFAFPIVFTPHLLPLYRGILTTIVIRWKGSAPTDLVERLRAAAAAEPFVRVLDEPEQVELRRVQETNYVDFGLRSEGDRTVIISAIDNLVKGAAGQAIQNLNLMYGFAENAGLAARS